MFNHKFQVTETDWNYDEEDKAFTITALQDIDAEDEIFLTYGSKCNSRLFTNYGFALPENSENTLVVECPLPFTDPLYWIKVRVMDNDVSAADNSNLVLHPDFCRCSSVGTRERERERAGSEHAIFFYRMCCSV
jgi:histone-lysine N-methyltransferase SETD3